MSSQLSSSFNDRKRETINKIRSFLCFFLLIFFNKKSKAGNPTNQRLVDALRVGGHVRQRMLTGHGVEPAILVPRPQAHVAAAATRESAAAVRRVLSAVARPGAAGDSRAPASRILDEGEKKTTLENIS